MQIKKTYYPKDRKEWHNWLKQYHSIEKEIWVIYFKKHTGKPRVAYDDAVEEALCFGWIDSTVKRIDNDKYCQRFTPRNNNSEWSELNKKRVKKLIKDSKMTEFGMEKVLIAKKNRKWNKKTRAAAEYKMPNEFNKRLKESPKAHRFFNNLPPSHKKNYAAWIASAKKEETKLRRIEKAISLLEQEQKTTMF